MATRAPNPLEGGVGYCEICKTWGHHPTTCPLLQKYQSTPRNLFCNFCKYVGHDEKDCHIQLNERVHFRCIQNPRRKCCNKEEFHSTILQEALTRVDEEDLTEVKDEEDLVEEEEDQSFVIIVINQEI
jgi:hypothetical protein